MTDIENRISNLKHHMAEAQARNARAIVEKENAQATLDATNKALKEEFGVDSIEEALELEKKIEAALTAAVAKAEATLEKA